MAKQTTIINKNEKTRSRKLLQTDTVVRGRRKVIYGEFRTNDKLLEKIFANDQSLPKDTLDIVNNFLNKSPRTLPDSNGFIKFNKSIMVQYPDIQFDKLASFKSMHQMSKVLMDDKSCRDYLEEVRWGGEPICPSCGSQSAKHWRITKGRIKCRDCRKVFSVTIGTIFEGSPIPLDIWFAAIRMISSDKRGVSSYHIHRELGITQKTAWFMLSRIRLAVKQDEDLKFVGITQVDETLVGGKNKNRKKDKKLKNTQGRSKAKQIVFGMLNEGYVYIKVVPNGEGNTLKPIIRDKTQTGSTIVSDGWKGYDGLWHDFLHVVINHAKGQYKRGKYHTNGIESFWNLLKHGIHGTYRQVSIKHLQRYCDEFSYRHNTNKMKNTERFLYSLIKCEVQPLTYRELIKKVA